MTSIAEYRQQPYTIIGYENLPCTGDQQRIAEKLKVAGYEAVWWKETSGHEPTFGDVLILLSDAAQSLYLQPSGQLRNHAGAIIHLDDLVE